MVVRAPIFHVNADDVEAVIHVCKVGSNVRLECQLALLITNFEKSPHSSDGVVITKLVK